MSDFATSAGHWYTLDGTPCYTMTGKNGKERNTTLRDARERNLVPSVTTIIRSAAAPGLERWKREQTMLAALTLTRLPGEADTDFLRRIEHDSNEQARKAAERGTRIHGAIERHFRSQLPDDEFLDHVMGAKDEIALQCGPRAWSPERSFAHPMGYGGKCDLHCDGWVIDYKSKEFDKDALPRLWDEHPMQLAAYRRGLSVFTARCAILYVSVTVPGLVHFCEIPETDLWRGLEMFDHLLGYWQCQTGHRPSVREAA